MINKITWAFICLAGSLLSSCQNKQTEKHDNTIDSLVTRTQGEVWGFVNTDLPKAAEDIKFITKRIYALDDVTQQKATSQQWQSIVTDAKGEKQKIYLSEVFNEQKVKQLIKSETRQTAIIKDIIERLKLSSASGIVLNFGDIATENVAAYLKFIKKLADDLHRGKLIVAIITSPHNSFNDKEIGELTEAIDYIIFNFDATYNIDKEVFNPYANGEMSVITTMRQVLMSPINLSKVLLLIPTNDRLFTKNCEFILHARLAGVAVNYAGTNDVAKLTDSLKATFQYIDTIRTKR